MAKVGGTEYTGLLEDPAGELLAELHVCFRCSHKFVAAHVHGASKCCSVVVSGLVSRNESELLATHFRDLDS